MEREKKAASRRSLNARHPEHHAQLSQAERKDITSKVMAEEIRPIVREQLTDDVMRGIAGLVNLTSRAVELLGRDMESHDESVSQKATALVLRYTLGNQSVAPAPAEVQPGAMTVNFHAPRAEVEVIEAHVVEDPAIEAGEVQLCCECAVPKPLDAFVGGSTRCQTCHDALQATIRSRFGS